MTKSNENNKSTWSAKDWFLLGANVLIFVILYVVYNDRLPDNVASHYNIQGEADRMMTKSSFWLMYAGIGVILPLVISILRFVDPRKNNYARFESYYYLTLWAISLFLQAIFLVVILDNLGHELPTLSLVTGGLGILWMVIGNRMGQVRSNFFIGIRTPWTLTDENNWKLTHRIGARLWFVAGLLMFASAWFVPSPWSVIVLLTCALGSSLIPVAYSYSLHKKNLKN